MDHRSEFPNLRKGVSESPRCAIEEGEPSRDLVPASSVVSYASGIRQMGDVLTEPHRRESIKTQSSRLEIGGVGQARQRFQEGLLDEVLIEIDLEVVEQADEVVFRGGHEGALYVDHHEPLGFADEVEIFGFEIAMREATWCIVEQV